MTQAFFKWWVCVASVLVVVLFVVCLVLFSETRFIPIADSTWLAPQPEAIKALIPRTLVQSWKSRDSVPSRVFDDVKHFAPGYEHVFLDDDDCMSFMQTYYPSLVTVFTRLKSSAHKADLLRYCYLFRFGGVWLDIKMVLRKPLDEIFVARDQVYTAVSFLLLDSKPTCYQGILASPPGSAFMRDMITSFLLLEPRISRVGYLGFCGQMYKYLEFHYPGMAVGTTHSNGLPSLTLFEEFNVKPCPTSTDRYNFCPYIRDKNGSIVFKVRDPDFPYASKARDGASDS